MNDNTQLDLLDFLKLGRARRHWVIALILCAALVATGTFWVMRYAAIAMTKPERVLECPYEVKTGPGYAGFVVHEHNGDCYDKDGVLVCTLPEIPYHIHDSSCYSEEKVLSCGQEESEGHVHTKDCYDMVTLMVTCGKEVGEGAHHHDESCFQTVQTLTCGKTETVLHRHTDGCLDEDGNLICGMLELETHVHGEGCFVDVIPEEDVPMALHEDSEEGSTETPGTTGEAAAEESELAEPVGSETISESENRSEDLTDGLEQPVQSAENDELSTQSEEVSEQTEQIAAEETTNGADSAEPASTPEKQEQNGDLNNPDQNVEENGNSVEPRDNASENVVGDEPFFMPAQQFSGHTETMEVTVEADEGAFPPGTVMKVEDVEIEQMMDAMTDAVEGQILRVQAVDISFFDANGNEIEPLIPIRVSMKPYQKPEADIQTVVHMDSQGEVSVVEQQMEAPTEAVSFESNTFSAG